MSRLDQYNPFLRLSHAIGGTTGWFFASLLAFFAILIVDYILLAALTDGSELLIAASSIALFIVIVLASIQFTALRTRLSQRPVPRHVKTAIQLLKICVQPTHLTRTGTITLVVGTWLTLFNHGDYIMAGQIRPRLWFKIFLNYLTPFVVSNLGLLSRHT